MMLTQAQKSAIDALQRTECQFLTACIRHYAHEHAVNSQKHRLVDVTTSIIQQQAFEYLTTVEDAFLAAFGWIKCVDASWRAPEGYYRDNGARTYAWNPETKQHDVELDWRYRPRSKALNSQRSMVRR